MNTTSHQEGTYPKSLLLGLGIFTVIFGFLDIYLMSTVDIYGQFVSGFVYTIRYTRWLIFSDAITLSSFSEFSYLLITYLFLVLILAYIIRWVIEIFSKKSRVTQKLLAEGSSRNSDLTITNFLTYRKNGISYHQLLTLSLLMIYFLAGQIYIYREGTAFEREGFDQNWAYIYPTLTFMILVTLTLGLLYLKEKISLNSLSNLINRLVIFLLFIAYFTLQFTDTEGFYLTGTILTYPLIFLAGLKVRRPVRFYIDDKVTVDENGEMSILKDDEGLPKWIFFAFTITLILLIFSFIGITAAVSDYNMWENADLSVFNFYTISYLILMIIIGYLFYYALSDDHLEEIELVFKRAFVILGFVFLSVFVYDDLYFSVDRWGEKNDILFLGTFVFVQLPAAILTGIVVAYGLKVQDESLDKLNPNSTTSDDKPVVKKQIDVNT